MATKKLTSKKTNVKGNAGARETAISTKSKKKTVSKVKTKGAVPPQKFSSKNKKDTKSKSELPAGITINIQGDLITNNSEFEVSGYVLASTFSITENRSTSAQHQVDGSNIAELIFEDGTEWIGYAGDINEIYTKSKQRSFSDNAQWSLPASIQSGNSRGDGTSFLLKVLNLFKPKVIDDATEIIIEKFDKKLIPNPGLYYVDGSFNKSPFNIGDQLKGSTLLLLHGTISSTDGSFKGMEGETWNFIHNYYDNIITLEHYTLSLNPIQNAIDVLSLLPDDCTIDILSHSRGGLIGDILSRSDTRNNIIGFIEEDILALKKDDENIEKCITEFNDLAKRKRLTINKFIRVACPANGTTLLSDRLDHFLNCLLRSIGLAFGGKLNLLYKVVKELLLDVVSNRMDASVIPGLWSMVPSSAYQLVNNRRDFDVSSKLFVIAGDGKVGGGLGNSLLVILSNLFYQAENDFVVDTKSMRRGLSRSAGLYQYLSRDSYTNHFNYFKNQNTQWSIRLALQDITTDPKYPFNLISKSNMDRGINLDLEMKKYNKDSVSGHKPIVLILPGIMGSTLDDNSNIWFDILRLGRGDLVNCLKIDDGKISASGVMSIYYKKLAEFMSSQYDVKIFPYDWRNSLKSAAAELSILLKSYLKFSKPIYIIAHSMGGLVMKQLMIHHKTVWNSYCDFDQNKLFLLGTPWHGSHLIMQVLTGHSKRVKQLNLLDLIHNKTEILNVISQYPGVYELLPTIIDEFEKLSFWEDKKQYSGEMVLPSAAKLTDFETYKNLNKDFVLDEDSCKKVFYIAGHDDTVFDYKVKESFFSGKHLVYLKTNLGDGSVTWELGIPKELDKKNIYYSEITHGDLANENIIFETIDDIIKFGNSSVLPQQPNVNRGEEVITEEDNHDIISESNEEILDNLFATVSSKKKENLISQRVSVKVYNADLKNASYPVMVGHFFNDGIYSAEKSLDRHLDKKLSERHRLGFYPGNIGESEITFHRKSQPKGALVLGMGKLDELTPYQLALSVEKAIIKYAFFFRDNYEDIEIKKQGSGITSIIMGSAYAGMPISDSIKAILMGVQRANESIMQLDNGLKPIKEVEFVDYYEDIAQQCFQVVREIENNQNSFNISVKEFKQGPGWKRRVTLYDGSSWWHTFTTSAKINEDDNEVIALLYSSTTGRARIEQDNISADLKLVEHLSKEFSHKDDWDKKLSKTMFELLVPNDFKSIIRNQSNIVWKMDEYAAQFPWEMFHDYNYGDEPTFVNTGLVRQLNTDKYRINPALVEATRAIIVGDPDYSNTPFGQLPGAAEEAKTVSAIINTNGYETVTLINDKAQNIIKELYSDQYKVIHFAAHGVYQEVIINGKKKFKAGIVLGEDIFLEPGTINQLSSIPELIFINCCFSGTMTNVDEKYYKQRSNLAANIGTQMIRMGVKAAVVAGWAVNDAAAKTFAAEFYRLLFEGFEFGIAVQRARRKCFDSHPGTNTWGAYQCYGDHYYKLVNKDPNNTKTSPFVSESQAVVELQNSLSYMKGQKVSIEKQISHLQNIKNRVDANNLESAAIKELYAMIYSELGKYDEAIELFRNLLNIERADFSVTSLEQYCSLRGKLLVSNYRKGIKVDLVALHKLIEDLEIVKFIGKTSERFALLGSAFKRAAILDGKNLKSHLSQMKHYFKEAYKALVNQSLEDTIYPFSNYLISCYCSNEKIDIKDINQLINSSYKSQDEMFENIVSKLMQEKESYKNYYKSNAVTKILICKFLYEKTNYKKTYKLIQESMMYSIHHFANMKHILGEREHIEFVMDFVEGEKKELLNKLCNEIDLMMKWEEV